jgi:hypothetical protein
MNADMLDSSGQHSHVCSNYMNADMLDSSGQHSYVCSSYINADMLDSFVKQCWAFSVDQHASFRN